MAKIIYAKSSNDRAKQFQVVTKIVLLENNNKIVVKSAVSESAKKHLMQITENFEVLCNAYKKRRLSFVPVKNDDDVLKLPYVSGLSFDEYLSRLIEGQETEKAIALMHDYFDELFIENGCFVLSDKFKEQFGEADIEDIAVSNVDIDALFANVLYEDEQWISYDYEWLCRFDMPKKFVIYRILRYFLMSPKHEFLKERLFGEFGIDEVNIPAYEKMEESFQAYVSGDVITASGIYENVHGDNIDVVGLANKYEKDHDVKCFVDCGDGYKELKSGPVNAVEKEYCDYQYVCIIPQDAKKMKFMPANTMCFVTAFEAVDNEGNNISYTHNGIDRNEGVLFINFEPAYEMDVAQYAGREISIAYHVGAISGEYDSLGVKENKLEERVIMDYIAELKADRGYRISQKLKKVKQKIVRK